MSSCQRPTEPTSSKSATWHLKCWHSGPERVPAVHLSWHCSFRFPANRTKEEAFLCLPEWNFICQPVWSLLCILRACILQVVLFSIPKNIVIFRFYLKRKTQDFLLLRLNWTVSSASAEHTVTSSQSFVGLKLKMSIFSSSLEMSSRKNLNFKIKISLAYFSPWLYQAFNIRLKLVLQFWL